MLFRVLSSEGDPCTFMTTGQGKPFSCVRVYVCDSLKFVVLVMQALALCSGNSGRQIDKKCYFT